MMSELIIRIALSVSGALAIGFVFGYLISRAFFKGKYSQEIKDLKYKTRKMYSESIILKDQVSHLKSEYTKQLKKSEISDISIDNIQPTYSS